jgi:predicted RND superfamily exporter protein
VQKKVGLIAVLFVTLVTASFAWQVRFDNSIEVWFLEKDPDLISYRNFTETFDSDQIVVLAYQDPALWTDEGLLRLHALGEAAVALDRVNKARSIVTISEIVSQPGVLTIRPLWSEEEPPDPAVFQARVMGDDLIVGRLVNAAGTVPAVILTVDHLMGETHLKRVLARDLRHMVEAFEEQHGIQIRSAGPTLLDDAFLRHTERDTLLILPLMVLVIIALILLLFRSWRALVLPLSVVGLASLWVTGFTVIIGQKLTIIHGIIYPMILGIGIATSVHLLTRTLLLRHAGMEPQEAGHTALKQLLTPSFFTAATTIAGLSSLNLSSLAPLKQFGQAGAFGVFAAFVLNYTLGPTLLPWLAAAEQPGEEHEGRIDKLWARWDRALAGLGELALNRAGPVMAASIAITAVGLWGITHLETGSNPLEYFQKSDPVRQDLEFIDRELAGTTRLEVVIDTGRVDGALEPAVLRDMEAVEAWMSAVPGVGSAISLAGYVKQLRKALRGGDEAEARIPDTRQEVAQMLLMVDDPEELEALVDFEFRTARITTTVRTSQADDLTARIADLDALLAETFTGPISAHSTGMSKLIANMDRYLFESATRSMALAFATVLLCMGAALRSVRLGLFSMIPNILPIALVLGIMGWVGIRLDPGTTMIGAVALGLVVDNTVHFLHHLRERVHAGDDVHDALTDTLMKTGRAVVTTSVVLVLGFELMLLASFNPNIYFGMLTGLAIAIALVADLVVLPAALVLIKPKL